MQSNRRATELGRGKPSSHPHAHGAGGAVSPRARAGAGATIVECLTYRLRGHYVGDTASYRKAEEVAEWRDKDKATNVLSFPAFPLEPGGMPGPMLGDIVIARETVEREALELEKSFEDHLTHLLVHGFLHLFGYDHMDEEEAEEMESLETRILAVLGLSDPYAGQEPL